MTTPNARRAFFIDPQTRQRPSASAGIIGFKAHNLARMAAIGLPVPHAFVLGIGYCPTDGEPDAELNQVLTAQLRRLESAARLTYGGSRRPLLLSIRAGAAVSMPAMMGTMGTILNVGLNETTVRGLLRMTGNPRLAWDSYRRLIQSFAEVVDRCPSKPFDELLNACLDRSKVARPQELDARALATLAREYLALYRRIVGRNFPQDTMEQLKAAVHGVFHSWSSTRARDYRRLHKLADNAGPAVTVQRMVFGNAGGTSGSGVAFTRDPASGENRLHIDFMFNAQGEDVMSGRHAVVDSVQLGAILPTIERQVAEAVRMLELEFKDMQEFEFTVQDEVLYLLQTRTGTRTALAELRIAADQVREGLIEPADALVRLAGIDLSSLREVRTVETPGSSLLCTATSASVGVATGAIALDVEKARAMAGEQPVILVRQETSTSDLAGLAVAQGLLAARGGRTSHAAVVARELNKVALVGCNDLVIDFAARVCRIGATSLAEGDIISLDGTTGHVFSGQPNVVSDEPAADLAEVERWRKVAVGSPRIRVRAS